MLAASDHSDVVGSRRGNQLRKASAGSSLFHGQKHEISLSYDPIHQYIGFVAADGGTPALGETAYEQTLIDHRWIQRLREIHQLQTAWLVYPTAEHSRFQHVLGAMHLGGVFADRLYDSLTACCEETPSKEYVTALLRMAGLLHDVGHGPYGHFFDTYFLSGYGLTHEQLGASIIQHELGEIIRGIRTTPIGPITAEETLDPAQIAWLIQRPRGSDADTAQPQWLRFLRSLLCGLYTIDNCDFVLRDAYMTGYSQRSFDLDRLMHYSFFTDHGLTISDRGIDALVRFLGVRSELFRNVYFHRTVRAIDLALVDLFRESADLLFPANPLEQLDEYLNFTEWSLTSRVKQWSRSSEPRKQQLGARWAALLGRQVCWRMLCQRSIIHEQGNEDRTSIFSDADFVEKRLREHLPPELKKEPLRVDLAFHILRPYERAATSHQNFLFDSARQIVRPLSDHRIYSRLPTSQRICRVYGHHASHRPAVSTALDELLGPSGADDLTNM